MLSNDGILMDWQNVILRGKYLHTCMPVWNILYI